MVGYALVAAVVIGGCGGPETEAPSPKPPAQAAPALPAPTGGPGVGRPLPQTGCTKNAGDAESMRRALDGAAPGDRICLTGDMGDARIELRRSGTPAQPIVVLGGGTTTTAGISVEASNVLVDGVAAKKPKAPGISLSGNNITVQNSTSISPRGGDGDGIRFWGNNIKILHNTIEDTRGTDEKHADCMQTFATDAEHPASQNVLIDNNRCADIANMCLIAEGPNSEAGDGSGQGASTNFVFSNNFCDNGVGQSTLFDDISNVTITGNIIAGNPDKAFSLQNNSTGAKISENRIESDIRYEVGMDDSSRPGYQGPEPGGGP